jgi:hypothetical protein
VPSETLIENLSRIERALVGNNYDKKLIAYRNVPDQGEIESVRVSKILKSAEENEAEAPTKTQISVDNDEASNIPTLQQLWNYKCELTRGRVVNCMCFNKQNEDIIAIAYGGSKLNEESAQGLILIWSAKNPEAIIFDTVA